MTTPAGFTPRCLNDLRAEIAAFAHERNWDQFHTPRNLLLAVLSELGEAADIVRWQGDADPAIPEARRQEWADEVADAAILLIRLAERSDVDLSAAIARKLAVAREKYPTSDFYGSNRKYSDPRPPHPLA